MSLAGGGGGEGGAAPAAGPGMAPPPPGSIGGFVGLPLIRRVANRELRVVDVRGRGRRGSACSRRGNGTRRGTCRWKKGRERSPRPRRRRSSCRWPSGCTSARRGQCLPDVRAPTRYAKGPCGATACLPGRACTGHTIHGRKTWRG